MGRLYKWDRIRMEEVFQDLELSSGLDANNPHHIWLVHYLFLTTLNSETHVWAEHEYCRT